jgi:hypothetical protein
MPTRSRRRAGVATLTLPLCLGVDGRRHGYTGSGDQWWTFDDAWSIGQKTAYIKSKGLLGAMIWEMSGDDGTLMSALDSGLR